ncbi:MAG: hypothetical protein I3274_04445 [Candidatus Moeniiplasma glomeromycotorum]|nr:hypothetical protein [Candidatus Moeniiplasma glomeromycotorum]
MKNKIDKITKIYLRRSEWVQWDSKIVLYPLRQEVNTIRFLLLSLSLSLLKYRQESNQRLFLSTLCI